MTETAKPFLNALNGKAHKYPPAWLMRQAGRYLPEYREVRAQAGSFLNLCYNPQLATEVTLQPIRRYGFDAAILFSDILVVPDALGQKVEFVEGEGPKLEPVRNSAEAAKLSGNWMHQRLEPVYEAVGRIRGALPHGTALIGKTVLDRRKVIRPVFLANGLDHFNGDDIVETLVHIAIVAKLNIGLPVQARLRKSSLTGRNGQTRNMATRMRSAFCKAAPAAPDLKYALTGTEL